LARGRLLRGVAMFDFVPFLTVVLVAAGMALLRISV
jgi:hypothetical protein